MAAESLASVHAQLSADPQRTELGWSDDMAATHAALDTGVAADGELLRWLGRNQPCIFGKFAATRGHLAVCVLTTADITQTDAQIQNRIQDARTEWKSRASKGSQSGFVIAVLDPRVRDAEPNLQLQRFAQRLAELYLLTAINADTTHMEDVALRMPGSLDRILKWHAGVNVFASAGDRRWWQDHRFPGGLALSVNSVGHLVRASAVREAVAAIGEAAGTIVDDGTPSNIKSLPKALEIAMRTIHEAQLVGGQRATELLPRPGDLGAPRYQGEDIIVKAPYDQYDHREYSGHYHTDHTIPSCYFRPDVSRSVALPTHVLDFTYLYDESPENVDHLTMGRGIPIAAADGQEAPAVGDVAAERRAAKRRRVDPVEISLREFEELRNRSERY